MRLTSLWLDHTGLSASAARNCLRLLSWKERFWNNATMSHPSWNAGTSTFYFRTERDQLQRIGVTAGIRCSSKHSP
jgi:hypothetical protein